MIKYILFLFKINIILIIIIKYSDYIIGHTTYAKEFNNKIYDNNQSIIQQLNQISDAHSQCLIQIQQQLAENQRDIDMLRGHIQDIQHRMSEMTNHQTKSCHKTNDTLNVHNKTYNANNISNTLPVHLDVKQHKKYDNNTTIEVDTAYKKAVSLVLEKKQYNQAIKSFQDFIKKYPESIYQSNSHYWLGQLYYNQSNKDNAAYHFAIVAKNYPKSLKAPDALLKIGIIMQETEQKDKAKTIYRQVGKLYPNNDASKQAQKRLAHLE